MDKAISILSGGLDSVVSTAVARGHLNVSSAVTFDYGQRAARHEIESAAFFCKQWDMEHRVIELDFLGKISKSLLTSTLDDLPQISISDLDRDICIENRNHVWVPNRNAIFINIAAAISETEGIKWIITGFNKEEAETFPDNSKKFIDSVNNCLFESTLIRPRVKSYVIEKDKTEILSLARDLDINIDKIWCCYDSGLRRCGRCESCARTIRAMIHLDIIEDYRSAFDALNAE